MKKVMIMLVALMSIATIQLMAECKSCQMRHGDTREERKEAREEKRSRREARKKAKKNKNKHSSKVTQATE